MLTALSGVVLLVAPKPPSPGIDFLEKIGNELAGTVNFLGLLIVCMEIIIIMSLLTGHKPDNDSSLRATMYRLCITTINKRRRFLNGV